MRYRTALSILTLVASTSAYAAEPLPLPKANIPRNPAIQPTVVTAGGKRLLLGYVRDRVSVKYDADAGSLVAKPAGWWLINYPLDAIDGMRDYGRDEVAAILFGKPASEVRNWYVMTPGSGAAEPDDPTGPAPITPTPGATLVVDQAHASADDSNAGTPAQPLATIGGAYKRASPGSVIHLKYGIYREGLKLQKPGTAERPIRIEGIRDGKGRMPIVSGNDVFPKNSWTRVPGLRGVYRAPIFTGVLGTMSVDGETLTERSIPAELEEGEFCFNRASKEFLKPLVDGDVNASEGRRLGGVAWRRVETDDKGMLTLGPKPGNAVWYASTWVWVSPKARKKGVSWDPRFPQPITGDVTCDGRFRAFRMTGTNADSSPNKYRMWVNGQALPSAYVAGMPRAHHNYGHTDAWRGMKLREGWNHLVFAFDTTHKPKDYTFKFGVPRGISGLVSSAARPRDMKSSTDGKAHEYVSEYLLAGPFPAKRDRAVYLRLPGGADPNRRTLDLAKRMIGFAMEAPFNQVRGLEIRHGASFQQRSLVPINGEGCVFEGCIVRDTEVKGIALTHGDGDQRSVPMVVRNNWILNPGNVGIGSGGDTTKLTPDNQNGLAPGRRRFIAEHNVIINNNVMGYPRFWESGGFKVFRMTGCVLRYNTIIGGEGPCIWLDWEHYNNRVEGNVSLDGLGFCVGVEASPGPNLVCNNLSVNLGPGGVWFRFGVLSWSSNGTWAVHNTIDGKWNTIKTWQNKDGGDGIYLDEGNDNRNTRWGALPKREQAVINNVVAACDIPIKNHRKVYPVIGNTVHKSKSGPGPKVVGKSQLDYRPAAGASFAASGVDHPIAKHVAHDFYGLLRFEGEPRAAGAFRAAGEDETGDATLIEVEFENGVACRLY